MPLPLKTVDGTEYNPQFLSDLRDAVFQQRTFALSLENIPQANLMSHLICVLSLYSEALRDPNNTYTPPTKENEQ